MNCFKLIVEDLTCIASERVRMAHYRQGHSVCVSGPDHLIVTGSIRDAVGHKVEQYWISENSWKELPDLRSGYFWHSSCTFDERYVFVVGGTNTHKKDQ